MYGELNNREFVERELIALLFARNELIDNLQIKPKYLSNKDYEKILDGMIRCYKEHQVVELTIMCDYDKSFPINEYIDIITNDMYYANAWEQQFKLSQELILKRYKEDIINNITTKLNNKEITYDEFQNKIDKIKEINITGTNSNRMKSVSDIDLTYKEREYIKSGCNLLDSKTKGFALGELSVWSGSNASAKSTYLNQIALMSINQGYKVGIFSGELTDSRLMNWLLLSASGKKGLSHNEEKDYWYVNSFYKERILKWLDGKLYIYDNTKGNDAKDIIASVRNCIEKDGVKVVILDNLMSMNLAKYGDQKFDMQAKLIAELSNMAKELSVHIHFVCHPRKSTAFLRKVDISGSADLTNVADNVFIMHRVNDDFKRLSSETFKWKADSEIYKFSNVIEVCKNREFGVQDLFCGLFFETETKRMLNTREEVLKYGWEYLE